MKRCVPKKHDSFPVYWRLYLYVQPLSRGCALLGESQQGIDTVLNSTQGNTLNAASAIHLIEVSASENKTCSTTVPATFRPPGHPKVGGAEGRVNQRQEKLRCKSHYGILPRKSIDRGDKWDLEDASVAAVQAGLYMRSGIKGTALISGPGSHTIK